MAPNTADRKPRCGPAVLDVLPSRRQGQLLAPLASGRDLAKAPDGLFRIHQKGEPVDARTVRACLDRQWINREPGYPLLDPQVELTPRGRAALRRTR
jgi:hypothetical protein